MAGFNYSFDATQWQPEQSGGGHPVGKFPATVSSTELVPIKDDTSGRPRFVVEFETAAGKIKHGYNLWSDNQKAVEISHKQLSALSHATGIFRLEMQNEGAALRGGRCIIEVGPQLDKEKKETGYVEVKKVYDANGNEPGKPMQPAQQQPQTQQPPPPQQPPAQQWGQQPSQPQQPAPQGQQWQAPPAQQPQGFQAPQQPPQQPAAAAAPWQQGQPTSAPPWANK